MNPLEALAAVRVPVHSINIISFARLPITGAAVAVVCFHKKRKTNWFTRWFGSEYEHVHLSLVRDMHMAGWMPQGQLIHETDAIVPAEVQQRLNLELDQSEKHCPMPSARQMADALTHIAQNGWGSIDASEFADLVLADPHIGPALRAYAKEQP
jgi:hypothetical protein